MIPTKQVEQKTLLTKAMILRYVKFNKEKNISKTSEEADAYEDVAIYLSSELATRQALELKNFETMLEDLEDQVLKELIKLLKRAKNEFWSPNITSVMFYPPMTKEDGPALAQAWINQAKKRGSGIFKIFFHVLKNSLGAAAGKLIDQKISQKRKDDRASENIQLTRQHTIIGKPLTQQEEQDFMKQIQDNMFKRQSTIIQARASQAQKLFERRSQMKEKQQAKTKAEIDKALEGLDREKTMMINTRKSQSTGLENRLDTLRLERTMTQARKSQGGLNFANQGEIFLCHFCLKFLQPTRVMTWRTLLKNFKLQVNNQKLYFLTIILATIDQVERQDTNELLLELDKAENETTQAEEEVQVDRATIMRERTMMRKSKKKNKE